MFTSTSVEPMQDLTNTDSNIDVNRGTGAAAVVVILILLGVGGFVAYLYITRQRKKQLNRISQYQSSTYPSTELTVVETSGHTTVGDGVHMTAIYVDGSYEVGQGSVTVEAVSVVDGHDDEILSV